MSSSLTSSAKTKEKARKRRRILCERHHQQNLEQYDDLNFFSVFFLMMLAMVYHSMTYFYNTREEIHRERKDIETDIFLPLGHYYFCRAYRMDKDSFYNLHDILRVQLEDHFFPKGGGSRCQENNPYLIKTELRLSMAVRYFAGGSPYDIMLTHGVSYPTVFTSIWGVVDCINKNPTLQIRFPSHHEQQSIARGFEEMSGAGFHNIIGAIDGVLIWTQKPNRSKCEAAKCGETSFLCGRKSKYGWNMQAICDNHLRFYWVDLKWPGSASDYMAWVTHF